MGLVSFIKEAGEKIFGHDMVEAPGADTDVNKQKAFDLANFVGALGLNVDGLDIQVDGDKVTVSGAAADQATKEKIGVALGNVAGISTVENLLTVSMSEPEGTHYTVVKGDSLSLIAKSVYGDPMKYPLIFEANKPMLTDPNLIYPGQVLRIPALS